MVARTDLELAPAVDEDTHDDVPWVRSPHAWLRRVTLGRCFLLVLLAAMLTHRLFVDALASSSLAFGALLGAGLFQALLFRFGCRRGVPATWVYALTFASFLGDVVLLSLLAFSTGGLYGVFAPMLVFPVAAAALSIGPRAAIAISTAALLGIVILAIGDPGDAAWRALGDRVVLGSALAVMVVAAFCGARWVQSRLEYLEHRVATSESSSVSGSVVDWEELPARGYVDSVIESNGRGDALGAIAAQISHELRDPAAMIRARAESLRYELRDRSRREDLLPEIDRLLRSADRLEDVRLTLATLGGARVSTACTDDPRALLDEIRDAFQNEFERDGIRLRFEAPRVLPPVGLTHNELRLVVVRWLDAGRRAALAHGRNARLVVRFTASEGRVVLEVEDPLPIARAPSVEVAADHEEERRPGLGLALAVARLLLVPRGGECETELRRGGGLILRARLPRATES